jgi:5-methylcytosine-specific restriction endonuclease McrA
MDPKRREYLRQWRKKNREKILQRRRELRQRPKAKEKAGIYRQRPEVKERDRQKSRKWSKTERGMQYRKEWYAENRERILQKARDYHAKPEVKERERERVLRRKYSENAFGVFARDGYQCQKCGSRKDLEIHHIDLEKTNNALENLVVLCSKCHAGLHNFIPMRLRRPIFDEWIKHNKGGLRG